jgi:hypothetical protein
MGAGIAEELSEPFKAIIAFIIIITVKLLPVILWLTLMRGTIKDAVVDGMNANKNSPENAWATVSNRP